MAADNISPELRAFVERNPIAPGRHSARRAGRPRAADRPHSRCRWPIRSTPTGRSRSSPTRTVLAIPMLRADELLGVIIIYRYEVQPFTDSQIALMETFADQAAIAIENARLLTELQAKNADLTEALEQQTATAEILRVISQLADRRPAGLRRDRRERGPAVRRRLWQHDTGSRATRSTSSRSTVRRPSAARVGAAASSRTASDERPDRRRGRSLDREVGAPGRRAERDASTRRARRWLAPWDIARPWACRCFGTGGPVGAIVVFRAGGPAVHRGRDRTAPADVRRPGGHRHPERPPVHRAGGAQQRAARRARAADGDQRAAQGDRPVHLRSAAGLRDAGRERRPALRGRARVRSSASTVRSCGWSAGHNASPERRRLRRAEPDRARARQRRGARRPRAAHDPHPRCSGGPRVHLRARRGRTQSRPCSRFPCCGRTSCWA